MVMQFFDVGAESFHDRFQAWRTNHQDGIFLNLETRSRAKLHGARCQHLGSGPPYFLLEPDSHSLTMNRKICGSEAELLAWATENGVKVKPCHHCLRDKLISDIVISLSPTVKNNSADDQGAARFWMCHWQSRYWRPEINREGQPVRSSGSNNFRKRGVSVGDIVYVVSLRTGQLYLGGRMTVKEIVLRPEAVRLLNNDNLYDAEEWIVGPDQTGTPLHLRRRLSPTLAKQIRFESKAGPQKLRFVSDTELDNQTTRGVRELTRDSAALLDRIIEVTDRLPRSGELITVTEDLLGNGQAPDGTEEIRLPEEIHGGSTYFEGSVERIVVNRYERDARARRECISHFGTTCFVCEFDFAAKYGDVMAGFIHVHHRIPLASVGADYQVNPVEDLRPVCPNCHAVLHRQEPPYELEEVRQFLESQRQRPTRRST